MPENEHPKLSEVLGQVRKVIATNFPAAVWMVAEIARISIKNGHCYLELVEKQKDTIVAKAQATIWASRYQQLEKTFKEAANTSFKQGMKILLAGKITMHPQYGFAIDIQSIDPNYTLGDMARLKREVFERLVKEGLAGKNKTLPFPLVPQRIAVVSSPSAAGFEDFEGHLKNNDHGYAFRIKLFPASMQGKETASTVVSALRRIYEEKDDHDVIIILRGGGSNVDLNAFDHYDLCKEITVSPLPILTGLGHLKDESNADKVAFENCITPTAAAQRVISAVKVFEDQILASKQKVLERGTIILNRESAKISLVMHKIHGRVSGLMAVQDSVIKSIRQRIASLVPKVISSSETQLLRIKNDIAGKSASNLSKAENMLEKMSQAVRLLHPINTLKRGFSITTFNGKSVTDPSSIPDEANIVTVLHAGQIKSKLIERL